MVYLETFAILRVTGETERTAVTFVLTALTVREGTARRRPVNPVTARPTSVTIRLQETQHQG